MSNEVAAYQRAMRENTSAREAVKNATSLIENVSEQIRRNLASFAGWQYDIRSQPPTRPYDPKAKFDMSKWPSEEDLRLLFQNWSEADTRLRDAWNTIPEIDRVGLLPPPHTMNLRDS